MFGGTGIAALGFRPAAAFVLLCVLVLAAQSGRDALEAAAMERRLAGASAAPRPGPATLVDVLSELSDALPARGAAGTGRAAASAIPSFLLPSAAGSGLFREFARKYPELAEVDPYDGLDDRERLALETEGRAFLEEFRTLIRKGER